MVLEDLVNIVRVLLRSPLPHIQICFLFDDTDPKIIIGEIPEGRRQIELSYNISILEGETAELLTEKLVPKEDEGGKEEGIKGRLRQLIKR